jgi:hypothetical protein
MHSLDNRSMQLLHRLPNLALGCAGVCPAHNGARFVLMSRGA